MYLPVIPAMLLLLLLASVFAEEDPVARCAERRLLYKVTICIVYTLQLTLYALLYTVHQLLLQHYFI